MAIVFVPNFTQIDIVLSDIRMPEIVGLIDRYGDLLWLIQPEGGFPAESDESYEVIVRFLEGTLELIQTACSELLHMDTAFTICRTPVEWESLPYAYDRIRQLQHLRVGDGTSVVMPVQVEQNDSAGQT
jgi:two-component system response regulator YesN